MPFTPTSFPFAADEGMLFSIVVPFYNEEESVTNLIEEIEWVMQSFGNQWELIAVNDGSTDRTKALLNQLLAKKQYLKILSFTANAGQTAAFDAGFKAAQGKWTITLDGDGQNDPRDIPLLIQTAQEGFDLVAGIRIKRKDPLYKKLIARIAMITRKAVLGDTTSDTGCSLKIYRTAALKEITLYKGLHRFLPILFQIHSFKITQIPVHHRSRKYGSSKYHLLNRGVSLIYDMLVVLWMRKRKLTYQIEQRLP